MKSSQNQTARRGLVGSPSDFARATVVAVLDLIAQARAGNKRREVYAVNGWTVTVERKACAK